MSLSRIGLQHIRWISTIIHQIWGIMLWDKYFGSSLAGEKRHCDGSLVGGVAVSRVSCTSNSAIAAMTPTPGERPVGPAAVEGRPRSNKSTMATTLVSGQLNMTQKLLAGFEQRRVDSAVASRATPTNSGAVAGQAPSPQAARRPLALGESGRRGNLDRPRFRQSGPVPPRFADPCCPYRGRGRHHRPR
jgi:hypothetical protein